MSTQSTQQKEAGKSVHLQSQQMGQLAGIAIPELQMILGGGGQTGMIPGMLGGMDSRGMLPTSRAALGTAMGQLNQGYQQAGFGQNQAIGYGGLRSGEARLSPGAMNAQMGNAATSLERQRGQAMANLNFMSSQQNMADFNKLLGLMGQGTQTALGLSQGFTGIGTQALKGLDPMSDMDKALAAFGSVVGIAGRFA